MCVTDTEIVNKDWPSDCFISPEWVDDIAIPHMHLALSGVVHVQLQKIWLTIFKYDFNPVTLIVN